MSRIAPWVALLLAAVCWLSVVLKAGPATQDLPLLDLMVAAAVALAALVGLRGRRSAQILMTAGAMVLLARALPAYFQTSQMWPFLVVIIVSTCTLGFGVLGILLDGFEEKRRY